MDIKSLIQENQEFMGSLFNSPMIVDATASNAGWEMSEQWIRVLTHYLNLNVLEINFNGTIHYLVTKRNIPKSKLNIIGIEFSHFIAKDFNLSYEEMWGTNNPNDIALTTEVRFFTKSGIITTLPF